MEVEILWGSFRRFDSVFGLAFWWSVPLTRTCRLTAVGHINKTQQSLDLELPSCLAQTG